MDGYAQVGQRIRSEILEKKCPGLGAYMAQAGWTSKPDWFSGFGGARHAGLANFSARMHRVTAKDFGLRCVSNFAAPKAYEEEFIGKFVLAALREFANYGIGPHNFTKNDGDRLFGYLVSFSLFNGNATFVLNRDGLVTTIMNGQNQADADLIKELLSRAHKCLPEAGDITHVMDAFCHAELVGEGKVEEILQRLVVASGSVKAFGVGVSSEEPAEVIAPLNERLRLNIAVSELRDDRLFMSWHFVIRGIVSEDFWRTMVPRLKAIAGSLGVELV